MAKNDGKEALISIIVPVYNVEDYVEECIKSLIDQTYSNTEIILVNDGSTDRSLEICQKYSSNKKIKVITQNNKGLSGARNTGIRHATGEYVGFVDSDDFIEPDMYQVLYDVLTENDADIACCGRFIFSGKIIDKRYESKKLMVFDKEEAFRELLLSGCIDVAAWDKLYKKDLFSNIEYPEGENNEDAAIIYKLFDKCKTVVHCGKSFYYYRQRTGSITKNGFSLSKSRLVEAHLSEMKTFLEKRYDGFDELFNTFYVDCNFPILLAGLKATELNLDEKVELKRRLSIHNKLIKYYIKNKNNSIKNKAIACMIKINIYNFYLYLKNNINHTR
jgi:glycosyltransferase involved in cell wall biosynthesis